MEINYIVVIEAKKEFLWMKDFLQEMGLEQEKYNFYCDSQSIIHLLKNPRSKYIDVGYH